MLKTWNTFKFITQLVALLCIAVSAPSFANQSDAKSIAFYYGQVDSVRELLSYQRVVLDASQVSDKQIATLRDADIDVYAYLSVGEAPDSLAQQFTDAIIGTNDAWQASILSAQNTAWREHLAQSAQKFNQRGFNGVFLDTLDSYQLALNQNDFDKELAAQRLLIDGLIQNTQVILNRGFELLPRLTSKPKAVVAESLFYGYRVTNDEYVTLNKQDSQWLSDRFEEIKQMGIEAIAIDYVQGSTAERINAARKILAEGVTPYVSDGLLTEFGVSTRYPIKRRVLGLYDGSVGLKKQSECHRFLAMLIEYQGYVPQCVDMRSSDLNTMDVSRYQAIAYWLPQVSYNEPNLQRFISDNLNRITSVFIGELPEQAQLLQAMGISEGQPLLGALSVNESEQKFPLPTAVEGQFTQYLNESAQNNTLLSIKDANNNTSIGALKASWGGILAEPIAVQEMVGDRIRWPVDPFKYLVPLFALPSIPVADVTTESGLRIATSHIDGDGFPSRAWLPGKPFAGASIKDKVLKAVDLPHTVSIIEAEIGPTGLNPKDSPELEAIARDIFALDNVEIASHTFSHPFFWDTRIEAKEKLYGDSLNVPNYTLDYDREIFGSVDYINSELAPAGKKVEVFLWSGMADPTKEILDKVNELGIYNVNGGNTFVLNDNFSVAQVYPHLNWYPGAIQVYAPTINENLYTELWTENYKGFSRVVETFKLLESPRRLKPISVYYHMYSGVYPASLGALFDIYDWVQSQPVTPLYLSEYAERARSLYETGFSYSINDDSMEVVSSGIRSLRIGQQQNISSQSSGIAGINAGPDGRFITLAAAKATLYFANSKQGAIADSIALQSANAPLNQWRKESAQGRTQITAQFNSHVPLHAVFNNAANCSISAENKTITSEKQGADLHLRTKQKGTVTFTLNCPQSGEAR